MDILKYLFFLVLGIILFIFLNTNDGFSVGVPEYKFTLVDGEINQTIQTHDTGVLAVQNDPVYPIWLM